MSSEQWFIRRHFIALVSNMIVFTGLSIVLYAASVIISADLGGPLTCIGAPFFNCISAAVFFPISVAAEQVLTSQLKWRERKYYVVAAVVLFTISVGLILVGALLLGTLYYSGNWKESLVVIMLFGGIPLLLGGPLYWFVLYVSSSMSTSA